MSPSMQSQALAIISISRGLKSSLDIFVYGQYMYDRCERGKRWETYLEV